MPTLGHSDLMINAAISTGFRRVVKAKKAKDDMGAVVKQELAPSCEIFLY